jgi:hypothetical protein
LRGRATDDLGLGVRLVVVGDPDRVGGGGGNDPAIKRAQGEFDPTFISFGFGHPEYPATATHLNPNFSP